MNKRKQEKWIRDNMGLISGVGHLIKNGQNTNFNVKINCTI